MTNDVLDEEYYVEIIGGDEPDAPLEELVDDAPPWRRAIESPNNGFEDLRIWIGLPLPDTRIIMVRLMKSLSFPILRFISYNWMISP